MGLLRRLFLKKGSFPAEERKRLEQERLVLIAEGIPGTVTRLVPGGGKPRRLGTIGAIALTQQRLVVAGMGQSLLDVTWDDGDAAELDITARDDGLRVEFDAERFGQEGPGRIEVFLRIGDPAGLLAAIDQRRRPLEPRRYRASS